VPEIIFTSSISVYGPSEEIKTEDSLLTPNSAYGYSKMLAERVHRHWYDDQNGRRLTIVRPAVVFGPGERGNFTRLAKLLQKGLFVYPGRKDTIKACIYVDDLIDCIEVGRNHESTFVLFNAAYPQRYTLEQIVETFIQKHFPKAKTALLPHQFVSCAASLLKVANLFDIGFSPERVTKLVHSTNISPGWLISQKQSFPNALEKALQKWGDESQGKFF
jgi:nucleoside-diphosphate-sugar epimerase